MSCSNTDVGSVAVITRISEIDARMMMIERGRGGGGRDGSGEGWELLGVDSVELIREEK